MYVDIDLDKEIMEMQSAPLIAVTRLGDDSTSYVLRTLSILKQKH